MATEKMDQFLNLVAGGMTKPPPVWNEELREALSKGLVTVGWGGAIVTVKGQLNRSNQ